MNKLVVILLFLAHSVVMGQELSQSIKGAVSDAATGKRIAGVVVEIKRMDESIASAATDDTGNFSLMAPPGRYVLQLSHVGYRPLAEELLVIAGKGNQLALTLAEQVTELDEVQVSAGMPAPTLPGATDLSIEKTLRVPANFFDPLRMAASLPGMNAVNDQGNALSVKGYSPNAILWKLEGLDIVNPNHLANAGTLSDKPVSFGGGVSILSSQVLDRTGVYSGWLPANYGNALSAVVDMNLRNGNKEKSEYTAQASLIGLDLAAEGPVGSSGKASYLANYRYSTVGLLSSLGLDFGDETINFQDLTFHLDVDQRNAARLSVFGFGGLSSNRFNRKPEAEWETEKDRYNIDFNGQVFGIGFKERWGTKVNWQLGSSFSGQVQSRNSLSADVPYQHIHSEKYDNQYLLWSTLLSARTKVKNSVVEGGVLVNYLHNQLTVETVTPLYINDFFPNVAGTVAGALVQPYANISKKWTAPWQVDAGIRYSYFSYNGTGSLEPRLSLQRFLNTGSLTASYSKVSQWQQAQVYLAANNSSLALTAANQFLLQYRTHFGYRSKLIVGAYHHRLSNIPVSTTGTPFSAINQWDDFAPANLASTGAGENTGTEVTFEKNFVSRVYFMLNGSVYKATYTIPGEATRDSRFSGGFTTSALVGKEWGGAEKTFGVHLRVLYLGGLRHPAIHYLNSFNFGTTLYDNSGYTNQLPNYWRPDLRIAWRKNKPGYTRTLSIDIQNVANHQNIAYYYFDTHTKNVETKYQLGIIPVLVYRVDF